MQVLIIGGTYKQQEGVVRRKGSRNKWIVELCLQLKHTQKFVVQTNQRQDPRCAFVLHSFVLCRAIKIRRRRPNMPMSCNWYLLLKQNVKQCLHARCAVFAYTQIRMNLWHLTCACSPIYHLLSQTAKPAQKKRRLAPTVPRCTDTKFAHSTILSDIVHGHFWHPNLPSMVFLLRSRFECMVLQKWRFLTAQASSTFLYLLLMYSRAYLRKRSMLPAPDRFFVCKRDLVGNSYIRLCFSFLF